MRHCRSNTAEEVKEDEPEMAESVFDVVAEDPEVKHVAEDMENPPVHEHGREERQGGVDGLGGLHGNDIVWDSAVSIDDLLSVRAVEHLEHENHPCSAR